MNTQIKDIGMRLQSLREDFEISIEEMAEKLGEDIEIYKKYENGEMDFSFSFIYNAAEILGVDVLDLISGDQPTLSMCSMVKKGQGYSVKREHEYDYKHLAYTFRNKKAEPFLVTINPDKTAPVLHGHEGQEFNYVIEGTIKVVVGKREFTLNAGDSIYFNPEKPHGQRAVTETAKFLTIINE